MHKWSVLENILIVDPAEQLRMQHLMIRSVKRKKELVWQLCSSAALSS